MPKRLSYKTAVKFRIHNLLYWFLKIPYRETYSQLGEDIVLQHILENDLKIKSGFYVEIGCNHPIKYSNSFRLYLNHWNGMTIDMNSNLITQHQNERKGDIQVCTTISNKVEDVKIYESESDLVNTISNDFFEKHKNQYKLKETNRTIRTSTLQHNLDLFSITNIDLLAIDAEGHDFEVLKSINLEKIRPKLIMIEDHELNLEKLEDSKIYVHLKKHDYQIIGYLVANAYFIDTK